MKKTKILAVITIILLVFSLDGCCTTGDGKKNDGNREISTAFLGKFSVGNSLYSNIKAVETPAVGKIAEKIRNSPKFHKKTAASLRRTKLCSKAGRLLVSPCGV